MNLLNYVDASAFRSAISTLSKEELEQTLNLSANLNTKIAYEDCRLHSLMLDLLTTKVMNLIDSKDYSLESFNSLKQTLLDVISFSKKYSSDIDDLKKFSDADIRSNGSFPKSKDTKKEMIKSLLSMYEYISKDFLRLKSVALLSYNYAVILLHKFFKTDVVDDGYLYELANTAPNAVFGGFLEDGTPDIPLIYNRLLDTSLFWLQKAQSSLCSVSL